MYSQKTITLGSCLRLIGIGTLVVLMVVYVRFQARNVISGPSITLDGTYTPLQHERRITLEGATHNIVKLTLNGKEIHTDEAGIFTHPLVLEDGYTIIELNAQDRFGRTTTITRKYVYEPLSV
jgi:hypothetical protein